MDIAAYLDDVIKLHKSGQTSEHSFRPALAKLFNSIASDVSCINEPRAITDVGRPDMVLIRQAGEKTSITVGHCEAKDIDLSINPKVMKDFNKAQFERYVKALPNLIYTNGLDFAFWKNGEFIREISIGDRLMGIQPRPDQFEVLANQLHDFAAERLQTITSAEKLAEMMAGKARLIKDILFNTLKEDSDLTSELAGQYQAFRNQLIHDLTLEDFSDLYAETIAYGMFAARLHDETLDTFSRSEAMNLLPKSNPFLRKLFEFIAGPSLPEGLRKTVDELAEVFQATDLQKLFKDFGQFTRRNDPFIHFYETFLAVYNPKKRKARGVWYTPEPVVNFIVRAIDDILKAEFGLSDGLADTSKITIDWDTGQTAKGKNEKKARPVTIKKEVHRVQILDPAAGTGTFLAEIIRQIAPTIKDAAPGQWSTYVEKELIPRLHGFELLMASYAMCHMKLDMMLTSLGYKPTSNAPPRLGVYLTNSLEEGERVNQTLPFAQWLSNEAKEANTVKNDVPVMVVLGNPPYNPSSQNKNPWILGKLKSYKKGLEETKINLDDDYIKFIRFAEMFVEKNGSGIVAMITNNSYLDGITQRMMRKHLMETFDYIQVLNLHGDIRNDGSKSALDENVFEIKQGVSIAIMWVKLRVNRSTLASVKYAELVGRRTEKYESLLSLQIASDIFRSVDCSPPNYRFLPANHSSGSFYESGFKVIELFSVYSSGVQTKRDKLCIQYTKLELERTLQDLISLTDSAIIAKFNLPHDGRDWTLENAKRDVQSNAGSIAELLYKPFDKRFFYYSGKTKGLVAYPRREVMRHIVHRKNTALIINRQTAKEPFSFAGVTDVACNHGTFYLGNRGQDYCLPLYLYPSQDELDQTRRVNMDAPIRKRIEELATVAGGEVPDEIAIFDYIYGVLHCPAYREAYAEFLKIDFPRIPYPPSPEVFQGISKKGAQLRELHLMEDAAIGATPYPFTGEGDSVIGKVTYKGGRVAINDGQGFDQVPQVAWDFFIGGYQPAQKWLKDRKGRTLLFDDVRHYQKIVKILVETDRIMKTIEFPLN